MISISFLLDVHSINGFRDISWVTGDPMDLKGVLVVYMYCALIWLREFFLISSILVLSYIANLKCLISIVLYILLQLFYELLVMDGPEDSFQITILLSFSHVFFR